MTEQEFCQSIRDRWGDAYASNLGARVEGMTEREWLRVHWEETWEGWDELMTDRGELMMDRGELMTDR